jgi:aminoglycoside phosphotransferase family enzyme
MTGFAPERTSHTPGKTTSAARLFYLMTFSVTVALGLRYLGVLLMGSLIIIPAATAKRLAVTLDSMLVIAGHHCDGFHRGHRARAPHSPRHRLGDHRHRRHRVLRQPPGTQRMSVSRDLPLREAPPEPALLEKVAFLCRTAAYADGVERVDAIETHMSWVFLADGWAYKLKKPVRYEFLDFSTREARRLDCEEEVRLNRRLAPDVYVGTVPLAWDREAGFQLEGTGHPVEWLVKMRRLPAERMLDRALTAGVARPHDAVRVATVLARFYGRLAPVETSTDAYRRRLADEINACDIELKQPTFAFDPDRIAAVVCDLLAFLETNEPLIRTRVDGRRIVEGHGDLRPEHVCLLEPPVVIDCLAFNRDLRVLDAGDEISYLAMECERLDAAWFAASIIEAYREAAGDDLAQALVHFYSAFRALVRAKLAAWHTRDAPPEARAKWIGRALQYLGLAEAHSRACG